MISTRRAWHGRNRSKAWEMAAARIPRISVVRTIPQRRPNAGWPPFSFTQMNDGCISPNPPLVLQQGLRILGGRTTWGSLVEWASWAVPHGTSETRSVHESFERRPSGRSKDGTKQHTAVRARRWAVVLSQSTSSHGWAVVPCQPPGDLGEENGTNSTATIRESFISPLLTGSAKGHLQADRQGDACDPLRNHQRRNTNNRVRFPTCQQNCVCHRIKRIQKKEME